METKTVNISTLTFLKVIIIGLVLLLLFLVKDVLAIIFLAFVFASTMKPWIAWLEKIKIPKVLSIIIIYLIFIGIFSVFMVLIVPPVSKEIGNLAKSFPQYYEKLTVMLDKFNGSNNPNFAYQMQSSLNTLSDGLSQTVTSIFSKTVQVFSGFFALISILVIAFYFASQENAIKKFSQEAIPEKYRNYIIDLFSRIQTKLGFWFRGQMFLCFIIFAVTWFGLFVGGMFMGGIKYALMLAVVAGIFEVIPFFGPWASGIIAVLLTFTQSPGKALFVAILYLVIQQAENSVIVPRVIGKSVGLNPIIVIISILVGFKLGGAVGAFISVPLIAALSVLLGDLFNKKDIEEVIG